MLTDRTVPVLILDLVDAVIAGFSMFRDCFYILYGFCEILIWYSTSARSDQSILWYLFFL